MCIGLGAAGAGSSGRDTIPKKKPLHSGLICLGPAAVAYRRTELCRGMEYVG